MFSPQSPRTSNKTRIRCQIGREDKEFAKKKGKWVREARFAIIC